LTLLFVPEIDLYAEVLPRPLQVIMATNRADTLDPALLRPGRLDRKIEFPMPDRRQKRLVFQVRARLQQSPARRNTLTQRRGFVAPVGGRALHSPLT
jgi:ATP-dependent 26S proteasome regulatory subunit